MPFSQNWTFCRAFSPLDVAHVSTAGRPAQRAGIVLNRPRWTRLRLRLAPSVCAVLRLNYDARALLGARGYAPRPSASPWAGFWRLGPPAMTGSPQAHIRLAWARPWLRGLRAGCPSPTPPLRAVAAPLRLRAFALSLRASGLRVTRDVVAHRSRSLTATTASS